ncbi:HEAT repeat domain-containing protein, partial [Thermodesulfobacteriota bacterium]
IRSPLAIDGLIRALTDQSWEVRMKGARVLGKIGTLDILKKLIQDPEIDIYDFHVFLLARNLSISYRNERTDFIPVYPRLVRKFKSASRQ